MDKSREYQKKTEVKVCRVNEIVREFYHLLAFINWFQTILPLYHFDLFYIVLHIWFHQLLLIYKKKLFHPLSTKVEFLHCSSFSILYLFYFPKLHILSAINRDDFSDNKWCEHNGSFILISRSCFNGVQYIHIHTYIVRV